MTQPVVTSPVVQAVGGAVVAALVGPLADWTVFDSFDPRQAFAPKSVMVAGTWDPDVEGGFTGEGAVVTETVETGAAGRLVETTTVQCLAYSGSGDWSFEEHRVAINAVLAAIRTQLRAIHRVDGASARAQMPAQQWASVADDAGTGAMALFSVVVTVLP